MRGGRSVGLLHPDAARDQTPCWSSWDRTSCSYAVADRYVQAQVQSSGRGRAWLIQDEAAHRLLGSWQLLALWKDAARRGCTHTHVRTSTIIASNIVASPGRKASGIWSAAGRREGIAASGSGISGRG